VPCDESIREFRRISAAARSFMRLRNPVASADRRGLTIDAKFPKTTGHYRDRDGGARAFRALQFVNSALRRADLRDASAIRSLAQGYLICGMRLPVVHEVAAFPRAAESRIGEPRKRRVASSRHRHRSCATFDESLGRLPIARDPARRMSAATRANECESRSTGVKPKSTPAGSHYKHVTRIPWHRNQPREII